MGARHFGIKEESVYGTAVVPDVFVEATRESIQDQPSFEELKVIRSWSVRQVNELTAAVRGDVEIILDYQTIGDLLYHFYGVAPDTTGVGPYTHTFPPSTGIPAAGRTGVSATVELRRDGTLAWAYAGCKIVGLALNISVEQSGRGTVTFLGKSEDNTITPVASPTYRDFDVIKPSHVTVNVDAAAQDARSFQLNMGFPADEPHVLGNVRFGKEPAENDVIAVAGSFEVYFEDMTEYDLFKNRTDVDVQLSATDATHSLTINCNKCRITQMTPPIEERNRLRATIEFMSFFDTAATENAQCVVVNDVATIP